MTLLHIVEYLAIGFGTGILSGLFGVGGGFILVPLLVLVQVPIHLAVGTSLGYVTCTSLSGSWKHIRNKNVHLQSATFLIIVASLILVSVGVHINEALPPQHLTVAFAILLFCTVGYFFYKRRLKIAAETDHGVEAISSHWAANLALGAVIGLLSGVFGVGGGFLLVPALVLILNMPIKLAVGTSLFVIIFLVLSGRLRMV